MQCTIQARAGVGAVLRVVQAVGGPLRRVRVELPSLILVSAGRKVVRAGGEPFATEAGEMLAVAAGTEIEFTNELPAAGAYEAFCLSFDPALLGEVSAEENPGTEARVVGSVAALGRVPGWLRAAYQRVAAAPDEAVPEGLVRHQWQEVLLGLELTGWRFAVQGAERTAVRLRRLLAADPARRWRVGEVGRSLGMSEATLRRRLEAEGVSFRDILAQVRMGRALALLQSSERSVTEVAYAVGYESLSQFTAKFRRHFGRSPGQLREPSYRVERIGPQVERNRQDAARGPA